MVSEVLLYSIDASLTVIRLYIQTPTAGGRIFEVGDKKLLQFANKYQGAFSTSLPPY